jgi:hypothetical protein
MHFSVVTTSTLHLGSSFGVAGVAVVVVVLFGLHVFVSAVQVSPSSQIA